MSPKLIHRLARFVGTHFNGAKGVERLLRFLHHPDKRQSLWVATIEQAYPSGPRYRLETRWAVEWQIDFYGTYDRNIHDWITAQVKPDWITFDIGANCGFFTTLLSSRSKEVYMRLSPSPGWPTAQKETWN